MTGSTVLNVIFHPYVSKPLDLISVGSVVNVTYIGKNSFKTALRKSIPGKLAGFPTFSRVFAVPPWPLEMLFTWDVEGLYVTPWRIIVTFAPSWNPTRCCQI